MKFSLVGQRSWSLNIDLQTGMRNRGRNMRWFTLRNISTMALVLSVLAAFSSATARGGNIYVTNYNNGGPFTIGEYTTSGGTTNASLGSDLFVANYVGGTIGEYTTSGAVVNVALVSDPNGPEGLAVTPAPEPATLVLLAAGAIGLVGCGLRRRFAERTAKPAASDQQDAAAIPSVCPSHSSPLEFTTENRIAKP